MLASPPVSEAALLDGIIVGCQWLAVMAVVVWIGVYLVRVRRLGKYRREASAEEELTAWILDQVGGFTQEGAPSLAGLPDWKRAIVRRVLCRMIEQTKGRDRAQLVGLLRRAGFADRALAELDSPSRIQREEACIVLGFFDDEASIAALRAALTDSDLAVRITAARALVQHQRVDSLRRLLEDLNVSHDDPPLFLSDLLASLPPALHAEATALLTSDLPVEWRRLIAIALGRLQVLDAFEPIAGLRRAPESRLRAAAWVALRELGDPRAGPLTEEGLADPSPDVRLAAARCAGQLAPATLAPRLAALLEDPDWWVAYQAGRALLQLGEEGRQLLESAVASAPLESPGRQAQVRDALAHAR